MYLSPGAFLGTNMVTARAAIGSHSCINLGIISCASVSKEPVSSTLPATMSVLVAGCTMGFGRPRTHKGPTKPIGGKKTAELNHDSWACKQRKLGYSCPWSNSSRQALNDRVKNVEIRMKSDCKKIC